ncbi:MAG: MoaD/ThiS family protein [Clostridia bacterium]|nr:MoaD/ThiS family protein [Clostridia bacterium]
MAKVTVKLFGVYRVDTHIADVEMEAEKLSDIFKQLGNMVSEEHKSTIAFSDATVFINGERCKKKRQRLQDGDEVWMLSPASGG